MAVAPEPYGYASVVTAPPARWQRSTRPSTRSTWRPDVLFNVAVMHMSTGLGGGAHDFFGSVDFRAGRQFDQVAAMGERWHPGARRQSRYFDVLDRVNLRGVTHKQPDTNGSCPQVVRQDVEELRALVRRARGTPSRLPQDGKSTCYPSVSLEPSYYLCPG